MDIVAAGRIIESGLLTVPFIAEKIDCFFDGAVFCALAKNTPLSKMNAARTIFFIQDGGKYFKHPIII